MSTNGKTLKFRAAKLKGFTVIHPSKNFKVWVVGVNIHIGITKTPTTHNLLKLGITT